MDGVDLYNVLLCVPDLKESPVSHVSTNIRVNTISLVKQVFGKMPRYKVPHSFAALPSE